MGENNIEQMLKVFEQRIKNYSVTNLLDVFRCLIMLH